MNGIAVIPARGGSKGIRGKNVVDLLGKPLIAYTIEPALKLKDAGLIRDVVVSTDDETIAAVAREYGAHVPCMRPAEISGDRAKTPEAILHMVDSWEDAGNTIDAVLVLQPTSPLRTFTDLEDAVRMFDGSSAESLISCYLDETMAETIMYTRDGERAAPLTPDHNKGVRRQDHRDIYIRNGAVYITTVAHLRANRRVISDRPLMYAMPKSRSINVDTEEDLMLVRNIMATEVN